MGLIAGSFLVVYRIIAALNDPLDEKARAAAAVDAFDAALESMSSGCSLDQETFDEIDKERREAIRNLLGAIAVLTRKAEGTSIRGPIGNCR